LILATDTTLAVPSLPELSTGVNKYAGHFSNLVTGRSDTCDASIPCPALLFKRRPGSDQ
ncbi:hypothetical protein BgiBS90_014691, partial [Biomphalaria glabrata]